MRKKVLLVLCLACIGGGVHAQKIIRSLEQEVFGQGRVTIKQDAAIAALLSGGNGLINEQNMVKTAGFRIQAYAGNNTRRAKNEAYETAGRVREFFPELTVYTTFTPPRWLCRVGDFRTIEEANAMMRRMKTSGVFKEVAIVKDQINVPL